jgi:uncharacterized integral membrane protein
MTTTPPEKNAPERRARREHRREISWTATAIGSLLVVVGLFLIFAKFTTSAISLTGPDFSVYTNQIGLVLVILGVIIILAKPVAMI